MLSIGRTGAFMNKGGEPGLQAVPVGTALAVAGLLAAVAPRS